MYTKNAQRSYVPFKLSVKVRVALTGDVPYLIVGRGMESFLILSEDCRITVEINSFFYIRYVRRNFIVFHCFCTENKKGVTRNGGNII